MDFPDTVPAQSGWYLKDQLVVALAHLTQVQQMLTELGVAWKNPPRESRGLGLALLELDNLSTVANELRSRARDAHSDTQSQLARQTIQQLGPDAPNLDLVMSVVRRQSAATYGKWTVTLGKNRIIRGIEGLPEIGGGAEGDPRPSPKRIQLQRQAAGPRGRIRVGVLDTQLFAHPTLEGTYVAAPDALLPDAILNNRPVPFRAGHATFIAGVILQRAPGADLEVHGVLSARDATASAWDVATKMVEFVGSGVDILNLSFGCATDDGQPPLLLARAVDQLSPEIVLVAAAGNHGRPLATDASERSSQPTLTPQTPYWPAALDDVIAVGARSGPDPAGFSPNLPWVDLTAPGVDIDSTYLFGRVDITRRSEDALVGSSTAEFKNGFACWSGTSFAAAYVTGEIAAFARRGQRTAREALNLLLQRSATGPAEGSKPFHP
jgi:hypothetical protein